jgi:hypothetical protein
LLPTLSTKLPVILSLSNILVLDGFVELERFIAVPVPIPFLDRYPEPDPDHTLHTVLENLYTILSLSVRSSIVSQNLPYLFDFFNFFYLCIPFYVESGSKSGFGTGIHDGSGKA